MNIATSALLISIILGVGYMESTDIDSSYVVHWENRSTGERGSSGAMTRTHAFATVRQSEEEYPGFDHWVERTKSQKIEH